MVKNAYIGKDSGKGMDHTRNRDFAGLLEAYGTELKARKYSDSTLKAYVRPLESSFLPFITGKGVGRVQDVSAAHLQQYHLFLKHKGLTDWSVMHYMRTVRLFFRHLEGRGVLFADPAAGLSLPKPEMTFRYIPTVTEVEKLIAAVDVSAPAGIRDRAMIETVYSTGMRRGELLSLDVFSPDLDAGLIRVTGKGKKERVVPLGGQAVSWIRRYLKDARSILLAGNIDENALWINVCRTRVSNEGLQKSMEKHSAKAGLERTASTHALRRACVTHMLQNGAHPLEIQLMLGHTSSATMNHYLKLTIPELKKAHRNSRPGK